MAELCSLLSVTLVSRLVCLMTGLWDGQQDNTKTTEQISMKLQWKMGLLPKCTILSFGADRDKAMDQGF